MYQYRVFVKDCYDLKGKIEVISTVPVNAPLVTDLCSRIDDGDGHDIAQTANAPRRHYLGIGTNRQRNPRQHDSTFHHRKILLFKLTSFIRENFVRGKSFQFFDADSVFLHAFILFCVFFINNTCLSLYIMHKNHHFYSIVLFLTHLA